jgi:hypothetical protein
MMRAYSDARYPHMDLVAKLMAGRVALAERIDKNVLSEEQAQLETQKLLAEISREEQRRQQVGLTTR